MALLFGVFGELLLFSACLAAGKHFYDSVVTHQTTDSTIVVSSTASKRLD